MALSTKEGPSVSPKLPFAGSDQTGPSSPFEPPHSCNGMPRRSWRTELKDAVRDPTELCRLLELPATFVEPARRVAAQFPLFVPHSYIAKMRRGDPTDPLLRQVLPLAEEAASPVGYSVDPVGDAAALRAPGLLRKYAGRVLLIVTGACAVHCRYCFRRHYPYAEAPKSLDQWEPALAEIASDDSLDEVILSGGDPLVLVDDLLEALVRRLESIPHLRRLRIHTRLPIVVPQRIDERLLRWFSVAGTRLTPICVVHANHAQELDESTAEAFVRLRRAGVLLLNQSVLLRGVNDSVDALEALSRRLVDLGVVPYYLHQLDRVAGAAHFETLPAEGERFIEALRERLPGYAVPRYVREVPGSASKTPIGL